MTLLAKALYDNLADAPDELSFRKGDIVTVIERDVDGLVGWWLCLLHGQQGIAPGNRLKIFNSPGNLDNKSNDQGSTENFTQSFDTFNGRKHHNPEYDVLPSPVKATHGEMFDSPTPKILKSVYSPSNIPSRSLIDQRQTNYAVPVFGNQGDYDMLPNRTGPNGLKGSTQMSPAELYDIPSSSAAQNPSVAQKTTAEELYDAVPRRRPTIQSTETLATNTPPPKFQNALSAFTAIPDESEKQPFVKNKSAAINAQEIYDTPSKFGSASDVYDTPQKFKVGPSHELYDTPTKLGTGAPSELYDVPTSMFGNKPNKQMSKIFSSDKSFLKTEAGELYDTPSNIKSKATSEALYDAPPSAETFKRNFDLARFRQGSVNQEGNVANRRPDIPISTNKNPFPGSIQDNPILEQLYDTPPSISSMNLRVANNGHEIYDTPSPQSRKVEESSEIYDSPPKFPPSMRADESVKPPNDANLQVQDIYDTPPKNQNSLTPSTVASSSTNEIYDQPPNHDIYDMPVSQDIYDLPPNRGGYDSTDGSLYDVPTQHDVNKVMNDIARFKTSNRSLMKPYSRRQLSSNEGQNMQENPVDFDEDDYVDYQDIYGKEPPKEMVKEMEKTPEATPRIQPKKPARKKSSFDQINMTAVKELKLSQRQAYDRLNKLHLAVDTSVTTLVSHTSGDWLDPKQLALNIDMINDMANKVKLSLRLLTEFGLGAMVNAKTVNRDADAEVIKNDIEPLLECYYKIKVCLLHLDGCKWSVPTVRNSNSEKFFGAVNAIMILAGRIPEACRKLTSTLHFNVKHLFVENEEAHVDEISKSLTQRMADLKMKSKENQISENSKTDKGKLKQLPGTVDDKKVREILELDARPVSMWNDQETASMDKANGAEMSPMEMKQEFQSRRQKGYNSTLPRRPPVPPKPNLPTNRRSMAAFLPDEEVRPKPLMPKADTLVTDFITEDGRKKYASDPSRSPVDPEPTRKPEWGGSCPQLDDHSTYASPQSMIRAASSGTAASTTSTASLNNSADDLDGNGNLNKMPSDSNLLSKTLIPSRVTDPVKPHVRSASLPWDDNKIPFTSYEKEIVTSSNAFNGNNKRLSKLDHRDSEALAFFIQRVESQFLILRDAVRNLTDSVSNNEAPQVFVSHSKFVILTAHKVVHAGEELCGKLLNNEVKFKVKRATARLADSIRGVVAGTKQAALDYPDQNSLMDMVTTVLSVGESVRDVHKEAKKALEI